MAKDLRMSLLLSYYGEMLGERTRTIAENYYDDDLSLSEIAENIGISRQGVRDHILRADNALLDLEQKLGFAARFQEISAAAHQIQVTQDAQALQELCRKIIQITD